MNKSSKHYRCLQSHEIAHALVQPSRFSTPKQWATVQIRCVQFVPESTILQMLWKHAMPRWTQSRYCWFSSISTKSWFTMEILRYNLCITNQYWAVIGPNSISSPQVFPWCHEGSSVFATMTSRDRIGHSKLESLPNVYDQCAITVALSVIFHTHKGKNIGLICDLIICPNITFYHLSTPHTSRHEKLKKKSQNSFPVGLTAYWIKSKNFCLGVLCDIWQRWSFTFYAR